MVMAVDLASEATDGGSVTQFVQDHRNQDRRRPQRYCDGTETGVDEQNQQQEEAEMDMDRESERPEAEHPVRLVE